MTNFECLDKDKLAEALSDSGSSCNYCYYNFYDPYPCFSTFSDDICVDGIKKWFEKEKSND